MSRNPQGEPRTACPAQFCVALEGHRGPHLAGDMDAVRRAGFWEAGRYLPDSMVYRCGADGCDYQHFDASHGDVEDHWRSEHVAAALRAIESPAHPETPVTAMYARLAREYEAEPVVPDRGGGVTGDLFPFPPPDPSPAHPETGRVDPSECQHPMAARIAVPKVGGGLTVGCTACGMATIPADAPAFEIPAHSETGLREALGPKRRDSSRVTSDMDAGWNDCRDFVLRWLDAHPEPNP